jgi:hypothetical protein
MVACASASLCVVRSVTGTGRTNGRIGSWRLLDVSCAASIGDCQKELGPQSSVLCPSFSVRPWSFVPGPTSPTLASGSKGLRTQDLGLRTWDGPGTKHQALGVSAKYVVHSEVSGNNGRSQANPTFLEGPPNETSS